MGKFSEWLNKLSQKVNNVEEKVVTTSNRINDAIGDLFGGARSTVQDVANGMSGVPQNNYNGILVLALGGLVLVSLMSKPQKKKRK